MKIYFDIINKKGDIMKMYFDIMNKKGDIMKIYFIEYKFVLIE